MDSTLVVEEWWHLKIAVVARNQNIICSPKVMSAINSGDSTLGSSSKNGNAKGGRHSTNFWSTNSPQLECIIKQPTWTGIGFEVLIREFHNSSSSSKSGKTSINLKFFHYIKGFSSTKNPPVNIFIAIKNIKHHVRPLKSENEIKMKVSNC